MPLLRDGVVVGVISLGRTRVQPFSERQIELVRTFADQAVIAIENARLITETREALEQQQAIAEVLQVINASAGELEPVFAAMLDKAMQLCGVAFGHIATFDGQLFTAAAVRGEPAFAEWVGRLGSIAPSFALTFERLVEGVRMVEAADVRETEGYRSGNAIARGLVDIGGCRSLLTMALRKEDALLGALTVYRQEVRPFTERDVALLQNFADQAVIAMENARLLVETREALEQQTATAEVLQVINASPGDLAPVFDAMLEKAMRLCEAAYGVIRTYDGQLFHEVARRDEADVVDRLRDFSGQGRGSGPIQPGPDPVGRLVQGERVVHIADLATEARHHDAVNRERIAVTGARTWLAIALQKEGLLLGAIIVHRREVLPFTDKQIALLQNFAAQAVIAMENARLLTETREALEQQTATAEVLQVINASPGDLAPVFRAMVERAVRLCEADEALVRTFDGELLHLVAAHGEPDAVAKVRQLGPSSPEGLYAFLARGESVSHIVDVRETATYREHPRGRARLDARNVRAWLAVALRREGALLGVINVHRHEVRPFTDKQIALLENFAAQAVIAMENARLLGELQQRTGDLQESLEYQTATSDVLKVISGSTFDIQPVFETIVATAARLCAADNAAIRSREGEAYRVAATFAQTPEFDAFLRGRPLPADRGSVAGRAALEGESSRSPTPPSTRNTP